MLKFKVFLKTGLFCAAFAVCAETAAQDRTPMSMSASLFDAVYEIGKDSGYISSRDYEHIKGVAVSANRDDSDLCIVRRRYFGSDMV